AQESQYPLEDKDAFGTELWFQALEYRQRGAARLLEPAAADSGRRETRGEIYLYEDVRSKPGALAAYHEALLREYAPVAASRGLALFGACRCAIRPNPGVNLWELRGGWPLWRELMESELSHPGAQQWLARSSEWLEDIDGYALAVPPAKPLRT